MFGPREVLLTSDEPVVSQFLNGRRQGPIGMAEEKDAAQVERGDGDAGDRAACRRSSRSCAPSAWDGRRGAPCGHAGAMRARRLPPGRRAAQEAIRAAGDGPVPSARVRDRPAQPASPGRRRHRSRAGAP